MNLSNLTILYVEDEIALTDLMQELLGDEVKSLYIAHDGEEGLMMFEQYKPDIVISDIYMPKLSGLNLSAIIKERYPDQPVILLTAFNDLEDLKKSIEVGVDYYINKPIQDEQQLHRPLDRIAQKIDQNAQMQMLRSQIESLSKNAAIGEVIAQIAHQWRQPLNIISTKITTMKLTQEMSENPNPELNTFFDEVSEQINYLSQTISDFRDFLRPKELSISFSLQKQFDKVNSLLVALMYQDKVNLVLPQTELSLIGYANKLTHVLINIINNAREAFHNSNIKERYIVISVEEKEDNCIIHIQDSANGIDETQVNTIFQPYFTTKPEDIGTGLGLFMAKEFVVGQMGGQIDVKNDHFIYNDLSLYGAHFRIEFPKISVVS